MINTEGNSLQERYDNLNEENKKDKATILKLKGKMDLFKAEKVAVKNENIKLETLKKHHISSFCNFYFKNIKLTFTF